MVPFEKENQSKSKNNNISIVQFMFVLRFFKSVPFILFEKRLSINDNCSLLFPKSFFPEKLLALQDFGGTWCEPSCPIQNGKLSG